MKFWLYAIDWRSFAVEILAECKTEHQAKAELDSYLALLSNRQRMEMATLKTIGITPVSPEMEASREQFLRFDWINTSQTEELIAI